MRSPLAALASTVLCLFGCTTAHTPSGTLPSRDARGLERAERAVAESRDRPRSEPRPAAVVGGDRVDWDELRASLCESHGAAALEELALDRLLGKELASQGLQLLPSDLDAERTLLLQTMTQDAGISPNAAGDMIEDLRARRGLGPARFESLLRRNAGLRRLVRDSVSVTNAELAAALAARYGERVHTRIIVVRTEREASTLRTQLKDVGDALTVRFAEAAMNSSVDASASRGGLLDPFSPEDLTYPIALRQAIQSLPPGERITPTVALDGGYALVLVERKSPSPFVARGGDDALIEQQLRVRKERIAMDQLARRLLDAAGITVFDDSLGWSWARRSR